MRDILETERLILRTPALSDAPQISRLASDKDISRMTGTFPSPFPVISAEFWIMKARADKYQGKRYPYAITTHDDNRMIGNMGLFTNKDGNLEIGYWLGRPYWGKGYITEAAKALLAEARTTLGISQIDAGVFSDNPASGRVLEKLGFKQIGEQDNTFSMARLKCAPGHRYKWTADTGIA